MRRTGCCERGVETRLGLVVVVTVAVGLIRNVVKVVVRVVVVVKVMKVVVKSQRPHLGPLAHAEGDHCKVVAIAAAVGT